MALHHGHFTMVLYRSPYTVVSALAPILWSLYCGLCTMASAPWSLHLSLCTVVPFTMVSALHIYIVVMMYCGFCSSDARTEGSELFHTFWSSLGAG